MPSKRKGQAPGTKKPGPKAVGRLKPEELVFLSENRDSKSAEELGAALGRDPNTIRQYMGLGGEVGSPKDVGGGARWEEIRRHFSPKESKYFREEYDRFRGDGEDDFKPAEEAQLIHALTLGILMNRTLAKQRIIEEDLDRVAGYRAKLEELFIKEGRGPTDVEHQLLRDLRDDVRGFKGDLNELVKQMTEFSKERNNILKQLKMTRDQRVQELEDGKETFTGLMKLFMKKETREKAGRRMDLLRLAVENSNEQLSKYSEFPDGTEDQPLLSCETVGRYDKPKEDKESDSSRSIPEDSLRDSGEFQRTQAGPERTDTEGLASPQDRPESAGETGGSEPAQLAPST